jgi:DNA topoisomerase III
MFVWRVVQHSFRRMASNVAAAAYVAPVVRVLNVAEKPSAAKEIATLLSGGQFSKRAGVSKFNHVFEFDFTLGGVGRVRMCVTSVAGHLKSVDFGGRYKSWHGCDPEELFDAPVISAVSDDCAPIARTLEAESRLAQRLILWLDCDREGEHIAHEVMDVCLAANRALDVKRARFSAFIEREIVRATQTLVLPNRLAADAVAARIELDLRIGAAFTRHQTKRMQRLEGFDKKVVSYGPCQFPTLGFVVDRYQRVAAFVPEPFWHLRLTLRKENQSVQLNWQRVRLFDQNAVLALFERAQAALEPGGAGAVVESMETKPTSKLRPLPLTTVSLQKLAARKLNLAAETTMAIAEKLYNGGYLSYPRTETDQFQKNFDLHSVIGQQRGDPEWGAYAAALLDQGKFVWPRDGKSNDQSHPPIHPTKPGADLTGGERAVYEMVARHFLACCSDDARGRQTTLLVRVGADEQFNVSGLMIDARNFLDVYKYETWATRTLPTFTAGERVQPEALDMLSGSTSPPSLLTEAELIALMDEHGIGTDATIAQHIATIQRREYAIKNAHNQFVPTTLGAALVDGYKRIGFELEKPRMRAEMEQDMQAIVLGAKTRDDVVRAWVARYRDIFRTVVQQAGAIDAVLGAHFRPVPDAIEQETPNFSACGCGGQYKLRSGTIGGSRETELLCGACARTTKLSHMRESTFTASPHRCPHCNTQVVSVRNSASGNVMDLCPQCYANPPPALLFDVENAAGAGHQRSMPCFACVHPTCARAKGHRRIDVRRCPTMCRSSSTGVGQLHMTTSDNGKVFLSCNNKSCGYTIFFPQDVTRGVATKTECPTCATAKPKRRSNLVMLSSPLVGTITTCVSGCDQQLLAQIRTCNKTAVVDKLFSKLGVAAAAAAVAPHSAVPAPVPAAMPLVPRPPNGRSAAESAKPATSSKRPLPTAAPQQQPVAPSSVASNSVCYRCQGVGHFAAQCPNDAPQNSRAAQSSTTSRTTTRGTKRSMSTASAQVMQSTVSSSAVCYRCQGAGHFAAQCPNANAATSRYAGGGGGGGGAFGGGGGSGGGGGGGVCKCGGTLIERVVGKDGPNKGRRFEKCDSSSCGVFNWL